MVVLIRKKGDGKEVGNYRGITLMSSLYKVYAMILAERLKKDIENKRIIPDNEAGFRSNKGTINNIFLLNYLVNRCIGRKGGKLIALFVD